MRKTNILYIFFIKPTYSLVYRKNKQFTSDIVLLLMTKFYMKIKIKIRLGKTYII